MPIWPQNIPCPQTVYALSGGKVYFLLLSVLRSPQREKQPHIGVRHPHQDRSNLRPGNGRVGPEGPSVVVASQDTRPIQLIDPGVRPIDIRNGPIRDQVDRRQRRVGEGVGQNSGKLLPGEGSVQILRQRGNDLLVDRIVRIGLVPGIRRGKGPVAGEIELPQSGCQRDGLDGGDRLGGLKFSGLGAVHQTILIRGSDVVVVPGALGYQWLCYKPNDILLYYHYSLYLPLYIIHQL